MTDEFRVSLPSGKVRLAKWYQTLPPKTKNKIVKDVTQLVLARRTRMSNILEYKGESSFIRLEMLEEEARDVPTPRLNLSATEVPAMSCRNEVSL